MRSCVGAVIETLRRSHLGVVAEALMANEALNVLI